MAQGWLGALDTATAKGEGPYHTHRLRNAEINSEETPALIHCSARRCFLPSVGQGSQLLSSGRSQMTAILAILHIGVVLLVRLI